MNEFLEQFLIESRELVEQATEDLLALEETPEDTPRLDSAFRGFHTLKGAASIVDFVAMSRVLHAAEDILSAARGGAHAVTADLVDDCLACLDQVVQWLNAIEAAGDVPDVPQATVDALITGFEKADAVRPAAGPAQDSPGWIEPFLARHPAHRRQARLALRYTPDPACFFRGEDPLGLISRLPGLLVVELAPRQPWPSLEKLDPFACNLVAIVLTSGPAEETAALLHPVSGQVQIVPVADTAGPMLHHDARAVLEEQLRLAAEIAADEFAGRLGSAGLVAVRVLRYAGLPGDASVIEDAAARSQAAGDSGPFTAALSALLHPTADTAAPDEAPDRTTAAGDVAARTLRVEVGRVDDLVKLTGELTVVKNAVGYAARLAQNKTDPDTLARMLKDQHISLDRLVGELQRSVLSIRVLPLRHVFQRFPRQIRELAQTLGKSVRLITEGETTEADKAVVEALFEPLLHVIRNALDHGIERPEDRQAAGKAPVATIRLRAAREGEHVVVEVIDDGRGIDTAKVRQVAAQRQVVPASALAQMTEPELAELIFAPGFSTASKVTGVSGRGVGMDAVRAAITRMGGQVGIRSQSGQGTAIVFTLPFTVMVSRVMTVEASDQVFGIPFETVVETVRVPRDQISRIGSVEAFVLRDQTVPLVSLAGVLDLARPGGKASEANIVITSVAGQLGALEVDCFGEPLEVMLKPMEGLLAGAGGIAGTTLLGDGRVLIVLDPQALLQ